MNGVALCAGGASLELGLELLLGDRYRTVGYCERQSYAAANLVARMEDAALDCAPVWDDLKSFPCGLYRGRVDIVSAGIPCQPFSCAGRRHGLADERWLWPDVWRVCVGVGAGILFLEEVPEFVSAGLPTALADLAEAGWSAEWDCFSAREAGAPHRRERLFFLAQSDQFRFPGRRESDEGAAGDKSETQTEGPDCAELGRHEQHADELSPWPPGNPFDDDGNLVDAAALEQWRKILAADPTLKPALHGVADGMAVWVEQIQLCGNGVVPVAAAYAFAALVDALGKGE